MKAAAKAGYGCKTAAGKDFDAMRLRDGFMYVDVKCIPCSIDLSYTWFPSTPRNVQHDSLYPGLQCYSVLNLPLVS